jgi:hypothetical protein
MTKALSKTNDYAEFLNTIKTRIRDARISAARIVNRELVDLYLSIQLERTLLIAKNV